MRKNATLRKLRQVVTWIVDNVESVELLSISLRANNIGADDAIALAQALIPVGQGNSSPATSVVYVGSNLFLVLLVIQVLRPGKERKSGERR